MRGPNKKSAIKFVLSASNFAKYRKISKLTSSQNLKYLTQKIKKIGATISFTEGWENIPLNFKMGQAFNGKQMAFQRLSTYIQALEISQTLSM